MIHRPAVVSFSLVMCLVLSIFTLVTMATGSPVSSYLSLAGFPFMVVMFADSSWRRTTAYFFTFYVVYNFLVHYGQIRQLDAVGLALLSWFGLCVFVMFAAFRAPTAQQSAAC